MKRQQIKTQDGNSVPFRSITKYLRRGLSLRVLLIFSLSLIVLLPKTTSAASLDFGWGSPVVLSNIDQKRVLIWPIQISNPTKQRWFAQLDVVAVTDTGKQYAAASDIIVDLHGDLSSLSLLKSNIFPDVTRRAVAIFEEVDPSATRLHFYVGGIIGLSSKNRRETNYFRITYQKSPSGWEWDGSNTLE